MIDYDNAPQLDALIADHQRYHSEYQMDLFITAKSGGTPYGMYRQALRELTSRHESLLGGREDIDELGLDLEDARNEQGDPRRRAINVRRKERALEHARLALVDKAREFRCFYAQAVKLKEQIGDLTPAKRATLEAEFWAFQARKKAALELICHHRIEPATLDMIWSLAPGDTRAILAEIEEGGAPALMQRLLEDQGEPLAIHGPETSRLNGNSRPCLAP